MAGDGQDKQERKRVSFRLDADQYEALKYRARARNMSIDEFCRYAIDRVIAIESGDYDVQDLLVQRENQIIDLITSQSVNIANLERVLVDGFSQLIGLTRGDNYLLEDETGDLL